MDITIIGDSVNVAARLEQLTREQKEWIIIWEETHAMLSDVHQFQIKDFWEASLKGRDKKINIYGVGD